MSSKSDELEDFEKNRIRRELNTRYTAAERAYIREYLNAQESKHSDLPPRPRASSRSMARVRQVAAASRQRRDSITAKLPPRPPSFPDRAQSLDKMNDEYGHYDHVVVTAQAGPGAAAEACRLRVPTYTTIGELKAILAEARRSDGFPMYAAGQKLYLASSTGKGRGSVLGQDHLTLAKYAFRREETVLVA